MQEEKKGEDSERRREEKTATERVGSYSRGCTILAARRENFAAVPKEKEEEIGG